MTDHDPCWVCRHRPHAVDDPVATALDGPHTYTTEAAALAEAARQPQGAPVWPVIDGVPLGGWP